MLSLFRYSLVKGADLGKFTLGHIFSQNFLNNFSLIFERKILMARIEIRIDSNQSKFFLFSRALQGKVHFRCDFACSIVAGVLVLAGI